MSSRSPDRCGPVDGRPADAAVVIPAYDEERVIGRCLDALAPYLSEDSSPRLEVVVAANGCSDRTVEVARARAGVTVLDIATGSKTLALNEGDAAAHAHPRIYLDADIVLSPEAVPALVRTLSRPEPAIAAPAIRFDLTGSSVPVRAFYRVFRELPYVREGLVGLGVYGLSRAGRERFDTFPDLVADDLYVQRLFDPTERHTVDGTFTVAAPRTLASLIAVRVRVAKGNSGLAAHDEQERFAGSTGSTMRALLGLLRDRPTLAPAVAVYVGVTLLARSRARAAQGREASHTWERDDSSRA